MTPTILVILGATGDLTARKISPALYHLYKHNQLPALFRVVGYARQELSDAKFQQHIKESIAERLKIKHSSIPHEFIERFSYHQGFFESARDYKRLGVELGLIDGTWQTCANKLFYLAVPPRYYKTIFNHLAASGLTKPCSDEEGWTRIIVEKPFGKDAKTANELDELLAKLFKEEQIYRIDHYLAKEMLQGILNFRFSNNLLESSWNNHAVEKIEISLLETLGVEDRGGFYDGVGALRDVGQNHLLQMLALLTMESPDQHQHDSLRQRRAEILATLAPMTLTDIKRDTFRAQYSGYRAIKGVASGSQTETYFKLKTFLTSPRWEGVPIAIEAGKRLKEVKKQITVTFKHPSPCFLCPPGKHYQNKVIFTLEPQETIKIQFLTKRPGFERAIEKRDFTFMLYEKQQKAQYVEEYSKLLLDCIAGDQSLYISSDEVKAMWRFIDPVLAGWQKNVVPLAAYKPDTSEAFEQSDRIQPVLESETKLYKQIAMVGLGKMGGNLARRLIDMGYEVVGFNADQSATRQLEKEGLIGAYSLEQAIGKLKPPRVVWLMVPAGKPVDDLIAQLEPLLQNGDTVIDGGNSFYEDAARRAKLLAKHGIRFVDVGMSGGPRGARTGPCLMVGGTRDDYNRLLALYIDVAIPHGVRFFPGHGAGHFIKMVHNGIEYGMMQAIAEGFAVLKNADYNLDLSQVADIYNHGSVIESRLVGWLKRAFDIHGESLTAVSGKVAHTGEGKWTVEAAKKMKIKTKVIEEALKFRIESQKRPSYAGKIVSALREQFGGHSVK